MLSVGQDHHAMAWGQSGVGYRRASNNQVHIFGQGSALQDIAAVHTHVHILMCLVVLK